MKLEDFLIVPVIDIDGNISDKKFLPFNIVSSSVSGGYSSISSSFTSSFQITDNHRDAYGSYYQAPMQGPYTEKYVGGEFYRHQDIASGTIKTRKEGYFIEYASGSIIVRTPATVGNLGEGNLVPAATQYSETIRAMTPYRREEFAKRPVSVANIAHRTGSTIVGNYDKPLEYFTTTGKTENNLWFRDFTGSLSIPESTIFYDNSDFVDDIDNDFEVLNQQQNKTIIQTRFSAPGESRTLSQGNLNQDGREYSVWGSSIFRNLNPRKHLDNVISRRSTGSLIDNHTVKQLPSYFGTDLYNLSQDYNWYFLGARNEPGPEVIDLSGNGYNVSLVGGYTWDAGSIFGGIDNLGLDFNAAGAYAQEENMPAIGTANEKMLIVSHQRDEVYSSTQRFSEIEEPGGDRFLLYSTAGDNFSAFDRATVHATNWLPRQNEKVVLAGSFGSNVQLWANGFLLFEAASGESFDFASSFDYGFGAGEDALARTGGLYGFAGILDQTLTDRQKSELFKTIMGRNIIYYWDYLIDNSITDVLIHWPLFETQSSTVIVADGSQFEYHGAVSGSFVNGPDITGGLFSSSVDLGSTSYISTIPNYGINDRDFTVEFWYQPNVASIGVEGALWSYGGPSDNVTIYKTATDRLVVAIDNGVSSTSFNSIEVSSGETYRVVLSGAPTGDLEINVNGTATSASTGVTLTDLTDQPLYLNNSSDYSPSDAIYAGHTFYSANVLATLTSFEF